MNVKTRSFTQSLGQLRTSVQMNSTEAAKLLGGLSAGLFVFGVTLWFSHAISDVADDVHGLNEGLAQWCLTGAAGLAVLAILIAVAKLVSRLILRSHLVVKDSLFNSKQ
jgi:hypothetical protein